MPVFAIADETENPFHMRSKNASGKDDSIVRIVTEWNPEVWGMVSQVGLTSESNRQRNQLAEQDYTRFYPTRWG